VSTAPALGDGLDALGIELAAARQQVLLDYLALLAKWNKTYNLTAIDEPARMLTHHLLDSLALLPHIGDGPLLDVGSGAGLPGIPLAIARPTLAVTLIDASAKKCGFMRQVAIELRLANIEVVHGRVESYRPGAGFAQIVSRAFSELAEFVRLTRHLLAESGQWLAMKGQRPTAELAGLERVRIVRDIELRVPGLDAERHLIVMEPA
jgi:16S rRNA (guanine527-N7)-methyltransferase